MPFYRLETSDDSSASNGDGMTLDTQGFLYVATKVGVQVCDQPGRVNLIMNMPQPGWLASLAFGGPDMQWLYVADKDKVYRRHTKRHRRRRVEHPEAAAAPPVASLCPLNRPPHRHEPLYGHRQTPATPRTNGLFPLRGIEPHLTREPCPRGVYLGTVVRSIQEPP